MPDPRREAGGPGPRSADERNPARTALITGCVLFRIIAHDRPRRQDYLLLEHGAYEPAVPADPGTRKDHGLPDVAAVFKSSKVVNALLRSVISAKEQSKSKRTR